MKPRSLGLDPITGIESVFVPQGETFNVHQLQDIEPILALNKSLRDQDGTGYHKGEMHHVASIPWTVYMQLAPRGFVTPAGKILDQKAYRKWLNSSEALPYRTKLGRV